jgi:N-acylneuraminate cytidylyltransferase
MNICIIPARGGSKRIPRKNIKNFCGQPIISWSIETALNCKFFSRVIVSTDDKEIAKISQRYGAEVPFMRSESLSDDYTGTVPVIKNAINLLEMNNEKVNFVCCLYPTAPFIEVSYLEEGLNKLIENNASYSISMTSFPYPIQRSFKLTKNNRIEMFFPENINKRSQDLEQCFHDAGQFYWGKRSSWLEEESILDQKTVPIYIPRYKVQDIDNEEDWIQAERIFSKYRS